MYYRGSDGGVDGVIADRDVETASLQNWQSLCGLLGGNGCGPGNLEGLSCFSSLSSAAAPSDNPKADGRNRQDGRKEGDWVCYRPYPKEFALWMISWSALIGTLLGVVLEAYPVVPGSSICSGCTGLMGWFGSAPSAGGAPSCRIPVAVLRRRGLRLIVWTPFRGLSRLTMSQ
jgi:hypothetical protein